MGRAGQGRVGSRQLGTRTSTGTALHTTTIRTSTVVLCGESAIPPTKFVLVLYSYSYETILYYGIVMQLILVRDYSTSTSTVGPGRAAVRVRVGKLDTIRIIQFRILNMVL